MLYNYNDEDDVSVSEFKAEYDRTYRQSEGESNETINDTSFANTSYSVNTEYNGSVSTDPIYMFSGISSNT